MYIGNKRRTLSGLWKPSIENAFANSLHSLIKVCRCNWGVWCIKWIQEFLFREESSMLERVDRRCSCVRCDSKSSAHTNSAWCLSHWQFQRRYLDIEVIDVLEEDANGLLVADLVQQHEPDAAGGDECRQEQFAERRHLLQVPKRSKHPQVSTKSTQLL